MMAISPFTTRLEKVARIISDRYSVTVRLEGNGACTDGKTIYLPSVKDVTDELYEDLNGFLDHEVGHVKFTDFSQMNFLNIIHPTFHKNLLNGVEDVRINRKMSNVYPGARINIDHINNKYIQKNLKQVKSLPISMRFIFSIMDAMEGNDPFRWGTDLVDYHTICKNEIALLNKAETTEMLRRLTDIMITKLNKKNEVEKEDKSEGDKSEGDKSEGDKSEGDKSEGDKSEGDKSEGDKSEGDKSEGDKSEGDKSEGDKSEGDKSEGDRSEGDIGGTENTASTEDIIDKASASGDAGSETNIAVKEVDPLDMNDSKEVGIDAFIQEELKEVDYAKERGSNYTIATTQFDKVIEYKNGQHSAEYNKVKHRVKPYINSLKQKLEAVLVAKEEKRHQFDRERGQLNARSFHRLITDKNFKTPFKTLSKTDTKNVAITILVDCSGSMGGSKMDLAREATVALAEALNDLNIDFEVLGFTCFGSMELYDYIKKNNLYGTSRDNEAQHIFVFKDFNQVDLSNIAAMKACSNNRDGEAVRFAADRLFQRKEARKILLVLSDGEPGAYCSNRVLDKDLKDAVASCEKAGIETFGLGIQTEAVKRFYKNYLVVNDIEHLAKTAIQILSKLLLTTRKDR